MCAWLRLNVRQTFLESSSAVRYTHSHTQSFARLVFRCRLTFVVINFFVSAFCYFLHRHSLSTVNSAIRAFKRTHDSMSAFKTYLASSIVVSFVRRNPLTACKILTERQTHTIGWDIISFGDTSVCLCTNVYTTTKIYCCVFHTICTYKRVFECVCVRVCVCMRENRAIKQNLC